MLKASVIFAAVILLTLFAGCDKNRVTGDDLPGEWVSTEKSDTLFFVDKSSFYQSNANMRYDHYDYYVFGDSIEIGYSGMMMILVPKTKHYFKQNGDELMIDFSNRQCFGFPKEKIKYKRVKRFVLE